jgi:hypothetical protein
MAAMLRTNVPAATGRRDLEFRLRGRQPDIVLTYSAGLTVVLPGGRKPSRLVAETSPGGAGY